jgi:hypothetical protein
MKCGEKKLQEVHPGISTMSTAKEVERWLGVDK